MIIDFHTHCWPEKVSQRAKEQLESLYGVKLVGDPTLNTLLKYMDNNLIEKSVVCGVASRADQVESINNWMFSIKSGRIEIFCSIHPLCARLDYIMNRIKENAGGIKIQPEFQQISIDDERMFGIYEKAQALTIPVLFHSGEELSNNRISHSTPEKIMLVKSRFPELIIIAAHYGGFRMWDETLKHLVGKDVYLDTSFFFGFLSKQEVTALLKGHKQNRILFGTDFPLVDQKADIEFLNTIDVDDGLKKLIFHKNAEELLERIKS